MYQPPSGRIRPYLEPFARVATASLPDAGDNLGIGVGAMVGAPIEIVRQFSLGSAVGASFDAQDAFDSYALGHFTSPITATFWWN